ncbi:MAG: hypothetical protein PHV34_12220 [Verrucomicrobiae bacterium]|nr:hypothetical protein [Verrucomicrobiae bacterium]
MKEKLIAAMAAVAIFLGGVVTGVWTQRTGHMPPPPPSGFGEMRGFSLFGHGMDRMPCGGERERHHGPEMGMGMERRMSDMEHGKGPELRPEMAAVGEKVKTLRENNRKKVEAVLKDDQKKKMTEMVSPRPGGCTGEPSRGEKGRTRGFLRREGKIVLHSMVRNVIPCLLLHP